MGSSPSASTNPRIDSVGKASLVIRSNQEVRRVHAESYSL
jgi:hypothetical protein